MIFGVYESSAGLYYDSLTTVLGCDSVEIQELIINTVDVSTTTSSNEITAVSSGPGISYQWIDCADDSEIVGETDQIYLATSDGNYAVVIDDNSCVDTSACVLIQGIGIDQGINDLEIKIYPNPSSGVFNIKVDAGLIENVVIYNTAGVEVEKVYNITQSSYNIDLSEYEDGVYLLKIITSSNQVITRLIIKK
ncbi:MAG: T9SS type A sorting domain-containing protein [Crocinitomicaceae bacterium]|nr:T9SS type A sorting domain-containing protein [Crocinitomicaceae bacterium]